MKYILVKENDEPWIYELRSDLHTYLDLIFYLPDPEQTGMNPKHFLL